MAKKNFWNKIKNIFVEEVKTKKNNIEIIDEIEKQNPEKLEEKELNNIIKILINEIIDGRDNNKEDIIKAIKHCEEVYFEEEKELEILAAIGNMQNDPEILIKFINATENYTKFDGDDHIKIREKRNEAIKKINELKFENIINEEENSYTDKNNIITVLNLIKNEQIKFENKEELKTKIIIIFNNIKEELYNDIEVLESLFQVLDNKLKNVESKEIEKTKKDIKRKIDIYYNTPGTNKEKTEAIIQIPINKIEEKKDTKEKTIESKEENQKDEPQIIKEETTPEIKEENQINTTQVEKQEIQTDTQLKEEYTKIDYNAILKQQEDRIRNAKNITDEEKQNLIEKLYKDFETYIGGTYNNSKTL